MGSFDIIDFVVYYIERKLRQLLVSIMELLTLSFYLEVKFSKERQYNVEFLNYDVPKMT